MITLDQLKKLELSAEQRKDEIHCFGSVSKESILKAESDIGLKFPTVYCWFLMTFGHGFIGEAEIFGLEEPYDLDRQFGIPYVVSVTMIIRRKYNVPKTYFVFSGNEEGLYYLAGTQKIREQDAEVFILDMSTNSIAPAKNGFNRQMFLSEYLTKVFSFDNV